MSVRNQELIELTEYFPNRFPRSAISDDVGESIFRQYKNQIAIEFPTPKTDWQWQLTSLGWVGYIPVTPEIGLYLSPKVPLKNLFGMLEYAYRLKSIKFMDGLASCNSLNEFYEQIAKLLAKRVLGRGRKGFYRSYYAKNERLPYVCGRLNVQKAIRQPWDFNLECNYEEFTSDIEDNQILAWTLHKILLTSICTENSLPIIRLAYRTVQGFASLKPFGPNACIKRLYNRLNQDYLGMHAICRFFLENSGPRHEIGDHTMIPFLVDMDRLFELFVAEWLRIHLPPGYSIKSQEAISLDKKGTIVFRIDLVLYDEKNGASLCVLDTKYKAPDSPSNSDIYQAVSYAVAKKCSIAVLIYPTSIATPFNDSVGDIRVRTMTFALDRDIDQAGNEFIQELSALLDTTKHEQTQSALPNDGERKPHMPGTPWDEISLFQELELNCSPEEYAAARKIFEWARINLPRFTWGEGKNKGSLFPVLDHNGESYWPISLSTYGNVEIQFQWLKLRYPFDNKSKRKEFLNRLNEISGINISDGMEDYRPKISLSVFTESAKLNQFFNVLEWVIQEIKTS